MKQIIHCGASRVVRISASLVVLWLASSNANAADSFATLFPGFVKSCAALHNLLVPFALVIVVLSFAFLFWNRAVHFVEIIAHLTKLFFLILLINYGGTLINDTQAILQQFLDTNIPARPENIAERYKQKLTEAQHAPERDDKGFFSRIFNASLFESLVAAVLTLISWAGMAVVWFVFLVQKVALLLCWALSPILFAFFAIPPISGIALRHALRILGILIWPIGLSLAATITEGLLDGMVKDSFLKDLGIVGAIGYGLNNLLALAVLAIWLVGSSIVFPLITSRMISSGVGAASVLARTGELTVNLGLPTLTAATMAGWSYVRGRQSHGNSSSHSAHPVPVPAMPLDTPEPSPTPLATEFALETDPEDPTGERRVNEALSNLQGRS